MNCIYCNTPKTYLLGDGLIKCAACKRKFSPKKLEKKQRILEAFLEGLSATKASAKTSMHYLTIQKQYQNLRREIALFADTQYQQHSHLINEFDEYLYLPKSIKNFDDNIHKMEHFITFSYHDKVYNIMMPTLKRYEMNLEDETEKRKLSKFLRFNKVAKLQKSQNTITHFWEFFEAFILRYKGVRKKQFIYYLKEAEFRFNYTPREQRNILLNSNF